MGSCILIVVEITIKMLRSVALLFVVIGVSHAQYYKTMENLGEELFDNYNGDVKPEEKVNVSVEMYVRDVYEVNPVKGYMDMQILSVRDGMTRGSPMVTSLSPPMLSSLLLER